MRSGKPWHPFLRPKSNGAAAPSEEGGIWATGRRLLRGDMEKTIHPNASWSEKYRPLSTINAVSGTNIAFFFLGMFLWVCIVVWGCRKLHERELKLRWVLCSL